jgi:hypothetical protein
LTAGGGGGGEVEDEPQYEEKMSETTRRHGFFISTLGQKIAVGDYRGEYPGVSMSRPLLTFALRCGYIGPISSARAI